MASPHIDQHFEALDRPKSPPVFMDSASSPPFGYDVYQTFDYLQFPHSPFQVPAVGRKFLFLSMLPLLVFR